MSGGTKHDDDKPQLHLIWWPFIWGMAKVLMFGAKKYAPYNWQKGISWSRIWSAEGRHGQAFWEGEDVDKETGLLHIYHQAVNLMFLAWHYNHRKDLDDRPRVLTIRESTNASLTAGSSDTPVSGPTSYGDRPSI